ncbi:MAG: EVE domain-containing protein [Deltaproteobacteria bacterium]|nr:EVE domain-containing protein [Deltaproteobacteria bacterium]
MNHWLMKSEPSVFSLEDLRRSPGQTAPWDGVRNYQARNYMADMRVGDLVLFYHSNCPEPGVAGTARVAREAYPDPTAWTPGHPGFDPRGPQPGPQGQPPQSPRWLMVDVTFLAAFPQPVTLAHMRGMAELAGMVLLRKGSRLSVQPVTPAQFQAVLAQAGRI